MLKSWAFTLTGSSKYTLNKFANSRTLESIYFYFHLFERVNIFQSYFDLFHSCLIILFSWFKLVPRIMSELAAALTHSLQSVKQQFLVIPDWPEASSQSESRPRLTDQSELSKRDPSDLCFASVWQPRMVSTISLTTGQSALWHLPHNTSH